MSLLASMPGHGKGILLTFAVMFFRALVLELFAKFGRYFRLISGVLLLVFGVLFFTPSVHTI